jgi:hypothetical protein
MNNYRRRLQSSVRSPSLPCCSSTLWRIEAIGSFWPKQLEIAGYRDIQFEQIDAQVFVGRDLDDAAAFQLAIGPRARCAGKPANSQSSAMTKLQTRSNQNLQNISVRTA